MDYTMDRLSLMLGTDFFFFTLAALPEGDQISIRDSARCYVKEFMGNNKDYFMHNDFGQDRSILISQFYENLANKNVSVVSIEFLDNWLSNLKNDISFTDQSGLAMNVIICFYSLLNMDASETPDINLSKALVEIKNVGFDDHFDEVFEDDWMESSGKWDAYIKDILGETPELPYSTYRTLTGGIYRDAYFIRVWRDRLDKNNFSVLKKYVEHLVCAKMTQNGGLHDALAVKNMISYLSK